jgi:hypothetical protein
VTNAVTLKGLYMMMTSEDMQYRKEIVEMARQVGLCRTQSNFDDWIDAGPSGYELEEFAKLVASEAIAKEREACAKLCDSVNNYDNPMTANDVADAIRARGINE